MPCASLHLSLAGRIVDQWRRTPRRAPVRMDRPENVQAFLHGALAPDMGFVPGTDRLVSDLAHYVRPGDLARRLLTLARSEEEEAFAWGWATHVLADVQIHPVVGRAVGERLFGDRRRRVDAVVDVAAHVSLEVGLDIALLRAERGIPRPPSDAYFRDARRTEQLAVALAEVYGVDWDLEGLIRHHRRAVELTSWWPRLLSLLPPGGHDERRRPGSADSGESRRRGNPWGRMIARVLHRLASEGSAARGFFRPEAPRRWFFLEVLERAGAFVDSFQSVVDDGLAGLSNLNLETGTASGEGRGHPATDLAFRELAALRRLRAAQAR